MYVDKAIVELIANIRSVGAAAFGTMRHGFHYVVTPFDESVAGRFDSDWNLEVGKVLYNAAVGTRDGWHYAVSGGKAALLLSEGDPVTDGVMTLPSELDGYPVTSVEGKAMANYSRSQPAQLVIPDSVTSGTATGFGVFASCKFTKITFGGGLKILDLNCLSGDEWVEQIGVRGAPADILITEAKQTKWYKALPDGPVYLAGVLCGYKGTMPPGYELTVKEGTRAVAFQAFYNGGSGYASFAKVALPATLTHINEKAFDSCRNLSDAGVIPGGVKVIAKQAFRGTALTRVELGEGAEEIGEEAFASLQKQTVTTVKLPATLKRIGNKAFSDGYYGTITVPASVTEIGGDAFSNFDILKTLRINCETDVKPALWADDWCDLNYAEVSWGQAGTPIMVPNN